ncbi:MAG: SIS domain-containing protein, partial [Planctomycetes bacterium]|nr:SIS domain-containing protein [Planctomycetota bacterium]
MCGIAGLLLRPDENPSDLEACLDALASLDPRGEDPRASEEEARRAEALSLSLVRSVSLSLEAGGPRAAAVRRAIEAAKRALSAAESRSDRPGIPLAEAEAWNAAALRWRDVAWRLEKDHLENLPRVQALARDALGLSGLSRERVLAHAFRLNLILNAVDRIEVRGRDSAGLGTVVWLPEGRTLADFEAAAAEAGLGDELARRRGLEGLVHGSVLLVPGARPAVVFAHKTAEEIGTLGQNVARIRAALSGDRLYWTAAGAEGAEAVALLHTRWASNGIVNEQNCHPVDDVPASGGGDGPRFLAVLNGDIDNYQALRERFAKAGRPVPPTVTTDAKAIPMAVAEAYRESGDVGEAFRRALESFEGSFAVALVSTAEPGRIRLGIRGSGQALYVGDAGAGVMVSSETYGLVEVCGRYVRMDGERPRVAGRPETAGQILDLDAAAEFPESLRPRAFGGGVFEGAPAVFEAAITTRDIHRGDFEHYFLKEISESPESLEKTLRGKFRLPAEGGEAPEFSFGEETVPRDVLEKFQAGGFRRAVFIGQGTASVAGEGIARLWEDVLGRTAMTVRATKASELSGFGLERDMGDTLVVAVSQSGTTTDTNRTVDLVKRRGARVLSIVNRRHSDLVHRSDGVVYTSDGRDVEMAVASTKAFYCQVAAGYLLGLYLASRAKALPPEEVARRLRGLQRLPDLLRELLRRSDRIRALAAELALRKRHWAVCGSGLDRVACEEIRIKLSELNYKSISCDFLEDKKHIDLSSEPLVLVCAVSQPDANVSDAVKEVSIFKAHRATPVVIAPDGEARYAPYAAGVIPVPVRDPELSFLVETAAGHLWAYSCARAIDGQAHLLKEARAAAVQALPALRTHGDAALASALRLLRGRLVPTLQEFSRRVRGGLYNSGLEVETAGRLLALSSYLSGQTPLSEFARDFGERGTWDALLDHFLLQVTAAIGELTRPIDAIKHQAKTVTVGISRTDETLLQVPLVREVIAAGAPRDGLTYQALRTLADLDPAIAEVTGWTRYRIEGRPEDGDATIVALDRGGVAAGIPTRTDTDQRLRGTKNRVAAERQVLVATGRRDDRPIVLVPETKDGQTTGLTLLHVRFADRLSAATARGVLQG